MDTPAEFEKASKAMENAGERIQLAALPLQRSVAECVVRCFGKMKNAWNLSKSEGEEISRCVSKCEEPVGRLEGWVSEERDELVGGAMKCMQRCSENDESCYKACVVDWMSAARVDGMVDRVIERIKGLRWE